MRRKVIVACVTASVLVGLGWQVSAFARPLEGPHAAFITTSSWISAPGGSLTVNGQNFAPDETILLTLFSHPGAYRFDVHERVRLILHSRHNPNRHHSRQPHHRRQWCDGRFRYHRNPAWWSARRWRPASGPQHRRPGFGAHAQCPEDAQSQSHHARARARDGHEGPRLRSRGQCGRFDQRERSGGHHGEQPRGVLRLADAARPGGGSGEGHRHVWTQEFRRIRQPGDDGEGFSAGGGRRSVRHLRAARGRARAGSVRQYRSTTSPAASRSSRHLGDAAVGRRQRAETP